MFSPRLSGVSPARPRRKRPGAASRLLALPLALAFPAQGGRVEAGGPLPAPAVGGEGEVIYRRLCASCHGLEGEGVEGKYERPLAGEKSLARLTRMIERKMPDGEPELCTGEDAETVARYIFDAFYSPIAQARRRPARVELTRLTVRQHRQALADLIGAFRSAGSWGDDRGLRGEYFDSHQPAGRAVLARVDPVIDFDFGRSDSPPPGPAGGGFAARWQGAVIAPVAGSYEILLRTDHAARLWLNDPGEPLIDAWVQSGSETEHRAAVFLLDGRAYPLRLEFSSRRQGVQEKEEKTRRATAFVELAWRLPGQVAGTIPSRYLVPERLPPVFTVTTPFPPDDRSVGYERGTAISKAWEEAVAGAAIETARYVSAHLEELAGSSRREGTREGAVRRFCHRFVERAFRRPLGDAEQELYVDRQFARAPDPGAAVKRVVALALASPRFLLVDLRPGAPDPHRVASALSLTLWDSLPDERLLQAAASGELDSEVTVAAEAARMVRDPRAQAKLRGFLYHWLDLEHVSGLVKDPERFPDFDEPLASDLRTSLHCFLEDFTAGESSDYRQLFLSRDLYLNGRLARYYGFDLPPGAPFTRVAAEGAPHFGLLVHPYVLARFAYSDASSPIHRGVFLIRNVLGQVLRPPPVAVAPLAADLHADLTTRERVELQTSPEACRGCHDRINPLGFTLEHYGADGRYREVESGRPVDATGSWAPAPGEARALRGARELVDFLAGSEEARRAFAVALFEHLVKQPLPAYGPETEHRLLRAFAAGRVHGLAAEIATVAAWRTRPRRLRVQVPVPAAAPVAAARPAAPSPAGRWRVRPRVLERALDSWRERT